MFAVLASREPEGCSGRKHRNIGRITRSRFFERGFGWIRNAPSAFHGKRSKRQTAEAGTRYAAANRRAGRREKRKAEVLTGFTGWTGLGAEGFSPQRAQRGRPKRFGRRKCRATFTPTCRGFSPFVKDAKQAAPRPPMREQPSAEPKPQAMGEREVYSAVFVRGERESLANGAANRGSCPKLSLESFEKVHINVNKGIGPDGVGVGG